MKKLLILTLVPAIALIAFNAKAATPPRTGLLSITLNITQGAPGLDATVTNKPILKGTNDVGNIADYIYKAKFTNSTLRDAGLLDLLAGSFGTTFAKGDTLVIDQNNVIYVAKGTNIIMDVSSVLSVSLTNAIFSDTGEFVVTTKDTSATTPPTTTYTGAPHGVQIAYARVRYDDSAIASPT